MQSLQSIRKIRVPAAAIFRPAHSSASGRPPAPGGAQAPHRRRPTVSQAGQDLVLTVADGNGRSRWAKLQPAPRDTRRASAGVPLLRLRRGPKAAPPPGHPPARRPKTRLCPRRPEGTDATPGLVTVGRGPSGRSPDGTVRVKVKRPSSDKARAPRSSPGRRIRPGCAPGHHALARCLARAAAGCERSAATAPGRLSADRRKVPFRLRPVRAVGLHRRECRTGQRQRRPTTRSSRSPSTTGPSEYTERFLAVLREKGRPRPTFFEIGQEMPGPRGDDASDPWPKAMRSATTR